MNAKPIIAYYKHYRESPLHYAFKLEHDQDIIASLKNSLAIAYNLPPIKALEYLRKRGRNLITTNRWDEWDAEAHDQAFTVAKVASADLLFEIWDYVTYAKSNGLTLEKFQEYLLPKLESAGWAGAKPSRLKIIYDTNMQMSYAKNKYRQQKLMADLYPYWKYVQVQRKTARHDHSLLHGRVFRHDDPIWQIIYPPSAFLCKCSVIPLKADEVSQIDNGSDIMPDLDMKEFPLKPLKAWAPDVSKYNQRIRKQLTKMLNDRKKEAAPVKSEKSLPELPECTENEFIQSWGEQADLMRRFLKNRLMTREQFANIFAGNLAKNNDSFYVIVTPGSISLRYTGEKVTITRRFEIDKKEVNHEYYKIKDEYREQGEYKSIFLMQLALYEQMGMNKINIHADIDVGCWSWAKYGFKYDNGLYKDKLQYAFNWDDDTWEDVKAYIKKDRYMLDILEDFSRELGISMQDIKSKMINKTVDWYGYFLVNDEESMKYAIGYCTGP